MPVPVLNQDRPCYRPFVACRRWKPGPSRRSRPTRAALAVASQYNDSTGCTAKGIGRSRPCKPIAKVQARRPLLANYDVDARDVGERSDAVPRSAMRGHDKPEK